MGAARIPHQQLPTLKTRKLSLSAKAKASIQAPPKIGSRRKQMRTGATLPPLCVRARTELENYPIYVLQPENKHELRAEIDAGTKIHVSLCNIHSVSHFG